MKDIAVMAVYGRLRLVEINLRLLIAQGLDVVVVTSIQQDFDFIRAMAHPKIHLISHLNYPLGDKWQAGVYRARELQAERVFTVGSDDFLSSDFVDNARCHDTEFIFFTHWSIYDVRSGKMYHLKYKNVFPLGSGRMYSRTFLERKGWKVFDSNANIHLDDFAWNHLYAGDRILMNPPYMFLGAVKGNWQVLNELDRILQSENIEWNYVDAGKFTRDFGFDVTETFKGL